MDLVALPNWEILFGFSTWSHLGEFKLHLKMFFWEIFWNGPRRCSILTFHQPGECDQKRCLERSRQRREHVWWNPIRGRVLQAMGDGIGEMIATYQCLGETWWLAVDAWFWGVAQFSDQPMWWEEKKTECLKQFFYIPYSAHFHMIFPVSFWSIFSPGGVLPIGLPGGPTAGAIMWRVAPRGLGEDPKTAGLTMKNWDVTSWSVEFTFVPKKRSEPTESTENGEFTKWNCKFGQEICRCCNWEDLGIDPTRWNKPGKTCINVSIDIHCQRMWEIEWAIRKVKTYHGHVQKLIDSSHLWGKCHTKSPCSPC